MFNYVKNTTGIAPPSGKLYVLDIKADNLRRIKGVDKIQIPLDNSYKTLRNAINTFGSLSVYRLLQIYGCVINSVYAKVLTLKPNIFFNECILVFFK